MTDELKFFSEIQLMQDTMRAWLFNCQLGRLRSRSAGCNSLTSEVARLLAELDLSHLSLSLVTLSNNIITTVNPQVEVISAVWSGQLSLYKTSVKSLQKQIWHPAYHSTSTWRAQLVCRGWYNLSHIQRHTPDLRPVDWGWLIYQLGHTLSVRVNLASSGYGCKSPGNEHKSRPQNWFKKTCVCLWLHYVIKGFMTCGGIECLGWGEWMQGGGNWDKQEYMS